MSKTLGNIAFLIACVLVLEQFDHVCTSTDNPPKRIVFIYNTNISDSIEYNKIDTVLTIDTVQNVSVTKKTIIKPSYLDSLLSSAARWKVMKRRCPVIRYYTKPLDSSVVRGLRKYGYYVHERPTIGLEDFYSNSIFFGDSVAKEDVYVVSYHLISSGLKIQKIGLSKYHNDWKSKALEVGTDTTVLKRPSINIEDLEEILSLY